MISSATIVLLVPPLYVSFPAGRQLIGVNRAWLLGSEYVSGLAAIARKVKEIVSQSEGRMRKFGFVRRRGSIGSKEQEGSKARLVRRRKIRRFEEGRKIRSSKKEGS
jgi:hypothetical protein